MAHAIEWRATVAFRRPDQLGPEHLEALTVPLPGFGVVTDDGAREVRLGMTVDAPTLRQATEKALLEARAAFAEALGVAGEPVELRVLPDAEHVRALERPEALDLVGLAEIADMLGVSRQRAGEIAETNDDFPAPVAQLAMGPVFTRTSVAAFEQRWDRRRTGRPSKLQTQVSAELGHIPADKRNQAQQALRNVYNMTRLHDLSQDPQTPAGLTLARAIKSVRVQYPSFEPHYDLSFFEPVPTDIDEQ